jgi:hypothetical protein
MPAEVKSSVLSPEGTRESEETAVQPFSLKKFKNSALICDDDLVVFIMNDFSKKKDPTQTGLFLKDWQFYFSL